MAVKFQFLAAQLAAGFLKLHSRLGRSLCTCNLRNLSAVAWILAICSACSTGVKQPHSGPTGDHSGDERPNIVFLLFDDAGYSDLSAFGGEIQTPNIERIVREGVTVRQFYTTSRCSPTRAGILTGLHPHEVGMADLAGPAKKTQFKAYQGQLPLHVPLVSEILQAGGYSTHMQGKWHLGAVPETTRGSSSKPAPQRRGFDHFVGFLGGQAAPLPKPASSHPYQHNSQVLEVDEDWFSIDELSKTTMENLSAEFLSSPAKPFFLYIASQSPHFPQDAPPDLIAKYHTVYAKPLRQLWDDRVSSMRELGLFPSNAPVIYPTMSNEIRQRIQRAAPVRAAMLEASDIAFGRLLKFLEENGKLDNTLIVVASDNGASAETAKLANAPFRGAKALLWEGGTLSPLAARWPKGKLAKNTIIRSVTSYTDLLPTFLTVAELEYPQQWQKNQPLQPPKGRNLLPLLRGVDMPPPENIYWELHGHFAMLHAGRWKLMGNISYAEARGPQDSPPKVRLYDLLKDPAETQDVAPLYHELTEQLLAQYQAWALDHHVVPYHKILDAYAENKKRRQDAYLEAIKALQTRAVK